MNENLLNMGYIMVSRALLVEIYEDVHEARGDAEAFLRVLTHVNFKDAIGRRNGMNIACARGESVISFSRWASILGWTKPRTRRFFEKHFADGTIEHIPDDCASHIRIPNYDAWTGRPGKKEPGQRPVDESLNYFIDRYHDITRKPRINIGRVARAWKKLSTRERELAFANVERYYFSLPDIGYCQQAATYLSDKAFLNDFD